jgi:hypothetical protein
VLEIHEMIECSKTVLIGLGPYSKRNYFAFFKKYSFFPKLIVDLESKREDIEAFLITSHLDIPLYLVPDIYKDSENIPENQKVNILVLLKKYCITHAIIATEPKAHLAYLGFLIENGIPIFVEKPLTSPVNASFCVKSAEKIEEDYLLILKKIQESPNPNLRVDLQSQRRYHPIYQFVQNQIESFVKEFDVPITYCDIYHSDGMWNMPDELISRENHPYKYGYGKLLHSGYHFIDLLANLLKACFKYSSKSPDCAELYGKGFFPYDLLNVLNQKNYSSFFKEEKYNEIFENPLSFNFAQLGELDFFSIIQFYQGSKKITTCTLNMLQTGFCRRAWSDLPDDTYKNNGRIRHERLSIQFGPLMNIQVHSYLSSESKHKSFEDPFKAGQARHFDILIFRNSDLIGGKPFELFPSSDFLSDLEQSFNEISRDKSLYNFLCNQKSLSDLRDHKFSIQLLSKALKTLCRENADLLSVEKFEIDSFIQELQPEETLKR